MIEMIRDSDDDRVLSMYSIPTSVDSENFIHMHV